MSFTSLKDFRQLREAIKICADMNTSCEDCPFVNINCSKDIEQGELAAIDLAIKYLEKQEKRKKTRLRRYLHEILVRDSHGNSRYSDPGIRGGCDSSAVLFCAVDVFDLEQDRLDKGAIQKINKNGNRNVYGICLSR